MIGPGVRAKCKNCGQEAPADQFKLHFQYKMMVCPACFTGKTQKEQEQKKAVVPKPAGWDAEDDYLEKASRLRRQEAQQVFTPIVGTNHVKYSCQNCSYNFKYDVVRKMPSACPYCNGYIPRVKVNSVSELL